MKSGSSFGLSFLDLLCCALAAMLIVYSISPMADADERAMKTTKITFEIQPGLLTHPPHLVAQLRVDGMMARSTAPGAHPKVTWAIAPGRLTALVRSDNATAIPGAVAVRDHFDLASNPKDLAVALHISRQRNSTVVRLPIGDSWASKFEIRP